MTASLLSYIGCEVCVWRPKCEAQESCVSGASPLKRDVQQREVRVSSQKHETRVSRAEHVTKKVLLAQRPLALVLMITNHMLLGINKIV